MHKITFTCETITPMFLSGADGTTPELRAPSIKGALRFWWRAMNGHLGLAELKAKEDEIFGGTDGRSKVLIRVKMLKEIISKNNLRSLRNNSLTYMAYGAEERNYFDVGTKFQVIFTITENDEEKYLKINDELKKAFSLLTHLGGLGAKSRNGFGAFICENTDTFEDIISYTNFKNNKNPLFSAITHKTEIYQSRNTFDKWETAIGELKRLYVDKAKNTIFPKSDRVYIAAPYKRIPVPARHAKLHLMSLTKKNDNELIYVVTYLPYNYMQMYEELNTDNIQKHKENWESVINRFNLSLEKAKSDIIFTFKK